MQQFGLQQFGLLTQRTQECGAMAAVAALAVARAASARVLALQPTVEQQQEEIERVQRRAEEVGMVEKTAGQSGVAGSMQRGRRSGSGLIIIIIICCCCWRLQHLVVYNKQFELFRD